MILKASICGGRSHIAANERVDWCIASNGVGQFTELGFRDYGQLLGWWEAPRKNRRPVGHVDHRARSRSR